MATTEILPFATDPGADVMDQADYAVLPARSDGFSTGTARSEQLNKVWRQSSFMAAGLANWLVLREIDVPDDGDVATLAANIQAAIEADIAEFGVTGPGSSTNNAIALFNGTGGDVIKDSATTLSTDGTFAANSDANVPTEKATKTYVDNTFAGVQTITTVGPIAPTSGTNTLYTIAHGLGHVPKILGVSIRCVNADNGWAVNDEVPIAAIDAGTGRFTPYVDATVCGFVLGEGSLSLRRHDSPTTDYLVNWANWRVYFYVI